MGEDRSDKLKWFLEAKYGMFIHWGLYAIPAGEWKGEMQEGHSEWIQYTAQIPAVEYEKLAAQFNPKNFDAAAWVSLAKKAGMKYLVITAKHHDGFCMFDSKLTDYDIADATPYKKDPLKLLAEECHKQGIKLGFYYSVKDWHHPQYPQLYTKFDKNHPDGFHGAPNPEAGYLKYMDYMQGQLRELLTNYGEVSLIWFDWSGKAYWPDQPAHIAKAEEIIDMIHDLQPNCLVNNRMGGIGGDIGVEEHDTRYTRQPPEEYL